MHVVGTHHRDARLAADLEDALVDQLLLAQAVILHLQEVVIFPHEVAEGQRQLFGLFHLSLQDEPGHIAGQTGRQRDKPLVLLPQQLHVDAGAVVIPLDEARGAQLDQVLVALLVLTQQHQVRVLARGGGLVKAAAGGDVHLAADDRMDALAQALLVKIHHAVHHAVIRDGQRLHAQFLCSGDQRLYAARAVQQRVFGVQVQVRKAHARPPPLLFYKGMIPHFAAG